MSEHLDEPATPTGPARRGIRRWRPISSYAGHGYATVRASAHELETEFVCIPIPLERSETDDGGPLVYRVAHRVSLWKPGERPLLRQEVLEGDPGLAI